MNTNSRKYNQYKAQAVYDNSGWNDKTSPTYKANNGYGCLLSVIIFLSLAIAIVWYNGLLF